MNYLVSTGVVTELLTSAEVQAHLIIDTSDATYVTALIKDAREYCEGVTGRALGAQTIKAYPDQFAYEMRLPREPIVSITTVKYTDSAGVVTTMSASNYILDEIAGVLAFKELPDFDPAIAKPIEITYVAGHTTLPQTVRRAMLILVAYWYENRGDKDLPVSVEKHVNRLLAAKKVFWA